MMSRQPPVAGRPAGVRSLAEGLRYVRGNRTVAGVLLIDMNAMFFGMPKALFPALATGVSHGGSGVVGLLYAAPAAGALIGAATSGWTGRVQRPGQVRLAAVCVWGAAIAA